MKQPRWWTVWGVITLATAGGCLSEEAIRRIEGTPGQEGTGVTLTRLPEVIRILATYEATPAQREAVSDRVARRPPGGAPEEGVRYLAVPAPRGPQSRGAVSVMLWDTESATILGNNVYDLEIEPLPGGVAMIDQYRAQFIAAN